ncbi:MAG: P-loop NTPase, partial [Chloroflexi bacterium]|nr:P-loop NTPase [Chloroflexota bacterium]
AQLGYAVGVLDADINGPSVAKMLGVRGASLRPGASFVEPVRSQQGIAVMSMDLLLPGDATPVRWDAPTNQDSFTWRGIMEVTALRELLSDTQWGPLDYLIIDPWRQHRRHYTLRGLPPCGQEGRHSGPGCVERAPHRPGMQHGLSPLSLLWCS